MCSRGGGECRAARGKGAGAVWGAANGGWNEVDNARVAAVDAEGESWQLPGKLEISGDKLQRGM